MRKQLVLIIIIGCLVPAFVKGQPESATKYTSPVYIDPLDIDKRDFRIINTVELLQKAEGAYAKDEFLSAARYYLMLVNNNCTDCESYYNLSRCYAMMGNADLAGHFLFLAVETGYIDFDAIRNEESFRKVRRDTYFRYTLESILKNAGQYGEVIWIEQTRFDRVRLFYPPGFDPEKDYPLVIALHGRGDNAINFSAVWREISDQEIILAIPEGPYSFNRRGPGLAGSYSWDIITRDEELMARADPEVTAYIAGISSELNKKLKTSYTLLMGFSQGAAYAYAAGIRYHEQFDGLVCFGGRIPDIKRYPWYISPEEMINGRSLPVFIGHGLDDPAIGYNNAENSAGILEETGYRVKLSLYKTGHNMTAEMIIDALEWFKSKEE